MARTRKKPSAAPQLADPQPAEQPAAAATAPRADDTSFDVAEFDADPEPARTHADLAEFERDLIRERTLAGLAAARARSRLGGRPRRMTRDKLRAAMALMADREAVAKSASR